MNEDKALWGYIYAYCVGFQTHPGAGRGDHKKLTHLECALVADQALEEYKHHWKEDRKCSEP